MIHGGRRVSSLLFIGDLVVFAASLWITLFIRYGSVPSHEVLATHVPPFTLLFTLWLLVFYLSGLYGKRIILSKTSLPNALLKTQVVNVLIAALFFFLMPGLSIAPKTNLLIYLGVSLMLIFPWRLSLFPRLSRPHTRDRALLVAEGPEATELMREVNGNPRYHLQFEGLISPQELAENFREHTEQLARNGISVIVVDTEHDHIKPLLPSLYDYCFGKTRTELEDFHLVYEDVFDRVPLSLLSHDWFLKSVATPSVFYVVSKRALDICGGVLMGLVTVLATPFVLTALRLEGPGPLFIRQIRIGEHGERVHVYKFRSMRFVDSGAWEGETENRVTRVGAILRQTSLDEFPQFINILRGELSLIGPRNDIEELGKRLADSIPYYMVRYSVRPGITGWAQINQQYEQGHISPQSIEETKMRLAYDFYYIKYRSLGTDMVIALKTLKRMLFRISAW